MVRTLHLKEKGNVIVNLHNFTRCNVTKEERQILIYGGGFVLKRKPTSDGIKKLLKKRRN